MQCAFPWNELLSGSEQSYGMALRFWKQRSLGIHAVANQKSCLLRLWRPKIIVEDGAIRTSWVWCVTTAPLYLLFFIMWPWFHFFLLQGLSSWVASSFPSSTPSSSSRKRWVNSRVSQYVSHFRCFNIFIMRQAYSRPKVPNKSKFWHIIAKFASGNWIMSEFFNYSR